MPPDDVFSESLLTATRDWLGTEGTKFFTDLYKEYGELHVVLTLVGGSGPPIVPWSVHFKEGMQVRNFMRSREECSEMDAHSLDDQWGPLIMQALQLEAESC